LERKGRKRLGYFLHPGKKIVPVATRSGEEFFEQARVQPFQKGGKNRADSEKRFHTLLREAHPTGG